MMAVSREATFRRKEGEETPRVRKRHSFSLASPCDALAASASRALPPHPPNSSIYQFSLFMFTNDGWYNDFILCTLGGGRTLAAFLLDFHSSELEEKAPSPSSSPLLHRCLGAAAA